MKIRPPQRILPNGVKDEVNVVTGIKTQNVSNENAITINGNLSWGSLNSSEVNTYRMQVSGWTTGKNIATRIRNSGYAKSNDGDYVVSESAVSGTGTHDYRLISFYADGTLYCKIEKSKIDAMAGANTTAKFKAYLNQFPIALTYQLAIPKIFMSKKIY